MHVDLTRMDGWVGHARRRACGFLAQLALVFVCGSVLAAGSDLGIVVSNERVPAGAIAQIKISLVSPQIVSSGQVNLDLDPKFFGPIAAIATFSAAGDAAGYAEIKGSRVEIHFNSASASMGVVNGLPLVVVTVPTLAISLEGSFATVTVDPSSQLSGPSGAYVFSLTAGKVTIGGSLSISAVTPGAGLLPAGSVIRVDGTGFLNTTSAAIEGVVAGPAQFAGPQSLSLTLGAPADLGGKRIVVRNPDGQEVSFYAAPPVALLGPSQFGGFDGAIPILATTSSPAGESFVLNIRSNGWIVLQNPGDVAADVILQVRNGGGGLDSQSPITIAARATYAKDIRTISPSGNMVGIRVLSDVPLRMLALTRLEQFPPATQLIRFGAFTPQIVPPNQIEDPHIPIAWVWHVGDAPPEPIQLIFNPTLRTASFQYTIRISDGANWLSVAPAIGLTCTLTINCSSTTTFTATPGSLSPGIYRATVTLTPVATAIQPEVIPRELPVTLTILDPSVGNTLISPSATISTNTPLTETYTIGPPIMRGEFDVSILTDSGGNWLTSNVAHATAPAKVTLRFDPSSLPTGTYAGLVLYKGARDVFASQASLTVHRGGLEFQVSEMRFAAAPGGPSPAPQTKPVKTICLSACPPGGIPASVPIQATAVTHSGGNWLSATAVPDSVTVRVNSSGLAAGLYSGAISLSAPGVAPAQFEVVLTVSTGPFPALTATPGSLFFTSLARSSTAGSGDLCIDAGAAVVPFDVRASTTDGGNWLSVNVEESTTPTCGVAVRADASSILTPGVYHGRITISTVGQSVDAPVVLTVGESNLGGAPFLGTVLNAASQSQGAIAPGEIITIRGTLLGPATLAGYKLGADGKLSETLEGVQLLIGGKLAPLLAVSSTQINAIVPNDVAGQQSTTLQVRFDGGSTIWGLPVAASAAGIFTQDSSGAGLGAILNQDNFVNSVERPADRGSVIQIFATGIPTPGVTIGGFNPPAPVSAAVPVKVSIGGIEAHVEYAGSAPGAIAGLVQVNAVVPLDARPGSAEVIMSVAGKASSSGVTVAIR